MGLFKKKTTKEKIIAKKTNFAGERLDCLDEDGNLPFGWITHNQHIVKPYEDKVVQMAIQLGKCKGEDRADKLEELIEFYAKYKSFCYKKGDCFRKYFQITWEHCHNSRCKDFEYIDPFIEEYKELKGQK